MTGLVTIPESTDLARELPSNVLYQLEAAGQLATEILDERVIQWTREGWSQQKIADELGCDQRTVGRRQERLGVTPVSSRGRPRKELGDMPNSEDAAPVAEPQDEEVVSGEVVNDPGPSTLSPDPGPRVKCPACGHMVKPDDIHTWRE
jgi:hypothetical protein